MILNLSTYKSQLIELESRPNKSAFDSTISRHNFENSIYEFFDRNYETYLGATVDERKEIRQIIKNHDRDEKDVHEGDHQPVPFRYFLNWYVIRAIKQLKTSGESIWLLRGLISISILDGLHDRIKDEEHLARFFVTAEEKGLDPIPAFQLISKISSDQPLKSGEMSTRELIANIPNTAHEIVTDLRKLSLIE